MKACMNVVGDVLGMMTVSLMSVFAHAELITNTSPTYQTSTSVTVNSTASNAAQMPSEDSAKQLMRVLRVDTQIKTLVQAGQMAQVATGSFKLPKVDEEKLTEEQRQIRRRIEQVLNQTGNVLGEGIENSLDQRHLEQAYIDAVQTHYTHAEVEALIGFYNTPMGQSILNKEPKVAQDFLQAGISPMSADTKQDIEQRISQILSLLTH